MNQLVSGDIQVYFSAGPPVVQMRLSGGDVAVTSCVVHKLTSKVMVHPAIQTIADLRGKVVAVANPGSASDFAAKLFMARQRMRPGQDVSIIYSGSTSAASAATRTSCSRRPTRAPATALLVLLATACSQAPAPTQPGGPPILSTATHARSLARRSLASNGRSTKSPRSIASPRRTTIFSGARSP